MKFFLETMMSAAKIDRLRQLMDQLVNLNREYRSLLLGLQQLLAASHTLTYYMAPSSNMPRGYTRLYHRMTTLASRITQIETAITTLLED